MHRLLTTLAVVEKSHTGMHTIVVPVYRTRGCSFRVFRGRQQLERKFASYSYSLYSILGNLSWPSSRLNLFFLERYVHIDSQTYIVHDNIACAMAGRWGDGVADMQHGDGNATHTTCPCCLNTISTDDFFCFICGACFSEPDDCQKWFHSSPFRDNLLLHRHWWYG